MNEIILETAESLPEAVAFANRQFGVDSEQSAGFLFLRHASHLPWLHFCPDTGVLFSYFFVL